MLSSCRLASACKDSKGLSANSGARVALAHKINAIIAKIKMIIPVLKRNSLIAIWSRWPIFGKLVHGFFKPVKLYARETVGLEQTFYPLSHNDESSVLHQAKKVRTIPTILIHQQPLIPGRVYCTATNLALLDRYTVVFGLKPGTAHNVQVP
jgi:hypothetical protein